MSLFLEAPDSYLKVEADYRGDGRGDSLFAFRVLNGKNAVTGWCVLQAGDGACPSFDEDVSVRVKSRDGAVVVREGVFTLRDGGGRSFRLCIALSEGCVVISTSSKKYATRISAASAFSCAYAPGADGKILRLTKAAVEDEECASALLFYSHGRCAARLRRYGGGALEIDVASRPADLVVPRRLAAEILLPQSEYSSADFNGSQASLNVRELYLDACCACPDTLAEKHPPCVSVEKLEPGIATPVHAQAMEVLTSRNFEASAGFRGEFGEYFCMARRAGDSWTVAAVTVKMRVLTLFFPYLDEGAEYDAEWVLDEGSTLPDNIEHITPPAVRAGDKAVVKMPACGGFLLRLVKKTLK